jgi:hypothetical protein
MFSIVTVLLIVQLIVLLSLSNQIQYASAQDSVSDEAAPASSTEAAEVAFDGEAALTN